MNELARDELQPDRVFQNFRAGVEIEIQDTAFWMAGCRAALEDVSRDPYAKHWLNEASRERHKIYTKEVSPSENIALSLRNRFFLERITSFLTENPEAAFVNVGAGFSSYPMILPNSALFVEIDTPEVVAAKNLLTGEFVKAGIFPETEVDRIGVNLNNSHDIDTLLSLLPQRLEGRKTFFLAEGLVYYLEPDKTTQLINGVNSLQSHKDQLGLVTWEPSTPSFPVYKRFEQFVRTRLGEEIATFTFHSPEEIARIPGYEVKELTGYAALSTEFQVAAPLEPEADVFWEDLYILEKK